jgi:hypothetical protein
MRIKCTITFLHGRERFEAGDIRTVPDELGAYFLEQGWVKGSEPQTGEKTLVIHDGAHGQKAVING